MADETVYVRSVAGKGPATRPTSLRPGVPAVYIGAQRDPDDPRRVVYSTDCFPIPKAEWDKYRREYGRMVAEGALEVVKDGAKVYEAQEKKREEEEQERQKKLHEETRKAEDAAKTAREAEEKAKAETAWTERAEPEVTR